jgi:small membrane protein
MNLFQGLVLGLLLMLAFATVRAALRGGVRKRIATFWMLIWLGTGVGVLWPRSTVLAARALGIGRGADLVLYCTAFAMLAGFFYIYTRFRRLDRHLTLLVRRLAVEHPLLPSGTQPDGSEPSRDPN